MLIFTSLFRQGETIFDTFSVSVIMLKHYCAKRVGDRLADLEPTNHRPSLFDVAVGYLPPRVCWILFCLLISMVIPFVLYHGSWCKCVAIWYTLSLGCKCGDIICIFRYPKLHSLLWLPLKSLHGIVSWVYFEHILWQPTWYRGWCGFIDISCRVWTGRTLWRHWRYIVKWIVHFVYESSILIASWHVSHLYWWKTSPKCGFILVFTIKLLISLCD